MRPSDPDYTWGFLENENKRSAFYGETDELVLSTKMPSMYRNK